ncbi:hypothetical protein IMZ31_23785 (plasmid) [Pontibacillus sp. ALD_SL1]|uniref:hypothetical protein n=1 Tax=Pontibacillus sp. ALD_SL1 TaxID=2777185 RepID=UPI001A96187E|nr:hypothetical protein [Pontibacillus sp. ALD_SL1]QST02474.1 hypothetical protein IMZ31_23785 [Pontibacillus sp. ALD_SL1]
MKQGTITFKDGRTEKVNLNSFSDLDKRVDKENILEIKIGSPSAHPDHPKYQTVCIAGDWFIEAYSEDFGYVYLLQKGHMVPVSFQTEKEAVQYAEEILS